MEKRYVPNDLKVFGVRVKTFPLGIKEAFDGLIKKLPAGEKRPYFGITECTTEGVTYKAAALEIFAGEAEKYGYETSIVEKGNYLKVTVNDWLDKTDSINSVFAEIFKDDRCDRTKPCIEIYKDKNEMECLVKVDERKELQKEFETATKELFELISLFGEEQINIKPFEGSWTAGQVMKHLVMSNSGFVQLVNGPVKETERPADEQVSAIKEGFLDFTTKVTSPDFVRPADTNYNKKVLLRSLEDIAASIDEAIRTLDLTKTCLGFELPVYGFLTRIEAIYFVIYHLKRHIHQLENILKIIVKIEA